MRPISYKCKATLGYHLDVYRREEAYMGGLFHCVSGILLTDNSRYHYRFDQKLWYHTKDVLVVGLIAYLA